VSLQDLDEVLILIRSHRVLHQVRKSLPMQIPRPNECTAHGSGYCAWLPLAIFPHQHESALCCPEQ
jgi:hypothetical protein